MYAAFLLTRVVGHLHMSLLHLAPWTTVPNSTARAVGFSREDPGGGIAGSLSLRLFPLKCLLPECFPVYCPISSTPEYFLPEEWYF